MKKSLLVIFAVVAVMIVTFSFFLERNNLRRDGVKKRIIMEELSISDAEDTRLEYVGYMGTEKRVLVWYFVSVNDAEPQLIALEGNIIGRGTRARYYYNNNFYFAETAGKGISMLYWQGGYCIVVNNTDCKTIRVIDSEGGIKDYPISHPAYPYLMYGPSEGVTYLFLDENGEQIS